LTYASPLNHLTDERRLIVPRALVPRRTYRTVS